VTAGLAARPVPRAAVTAATDRLLLCGVVAGPLFIVAATAHALLRPGFDVVHHPLSLLSTGGLGWIQIATFVVSGLLFLACAVGLRRVLRGSRGGTWGPWLIGVFAVLVVAGGVFVADPALGFPPGTPPGRPAEFSWHGILHAIAPVAAFAALSAAGLVFARRAAVLGQGGWAVVSVTVAVAVQALGMWSNVTWNFIPLGAAVVLGFGWASAQAARIRAGS